MASFLNNVLTAHFALVFVAMLICLVGYAIPGYRARTTGGFLIVCVKVALNV